MRPILYSKASEYAVAALVHLAKCPSGEYVHVKDIARDENIPAGFLSGLLQRLSKDGLVASRKGLKGGFALRSDPDTVSLLDVVCAIDGMPRWERCAMGYPACAPEDPCEMHDGWIEVRDRIRAFMQLTTIGELANARLLRKPEPVLASLNPAINPH
jgi:Rrf2 family iron-sulfur cluster assembly transcriptional regulator